MGLFSKSEKKQEEPKKPVKLGAVHEGTADPEHKDYRRRDGESQQDYNERVPVAFQPVEEVGKFDYLGRKRD